MGATCERRCLAWALARPHIRCTHARRSDTRAPFKNTPTLARRRSEYQGEDPWLASKMVEAEIIGIQSQNVSGA